MSLPKTITDARGILKPDAPFDHHDHQEAEYFVWSMGSAIDDVMTLASRGEAERAALRTEEGAIVSAWMRLNHLVEHLGLVKRQEAA